MKKLLGLTFIAVALFSCNKEKSLNTAGINPPNWLQGEWCDSLSEKQGNCEYTPDYVITSDNFIIRNAGGEIVNVKSVGSMQGNSYSDQLNGNVYTITLSGSGNQQEFYFENLQNGYMCYTPDEPSSCISYKKVQ